MAPSVHRTFALSFAGFGKSRVADIGVVKARADPHYVCRRPGGVRCGSLPAIPGRRNLEADLAAASRKAAVTGDGDGNADDGSFLRRMESRAYLVQ